MDYVKVYWPYGVAGLAALGVAAAIILLIRRAKIRKKSPKQKAEPAAPRDPAHIEAIAALEKVKTEHIYSKGKIKEYHTSITDILREYLSREFDINAHELTSSQIMKRLRYSGIDEKNMKQLRTLLFRADMVKFAKEIPDEQENRAAADEGLAFVKDTHVEEETEQVVETGSEKTQETQNG